MFGIRAFVTVVYVVSGAGLFVGCSESRQPDSTHIEAQSKKADLFKLDLEETRRSKELAPSVHSPESKTLREWNQIPGVEIPAGLFAMTKRPASPKYASFQPRPQPHPNDPDGLTSEDCWGATDIISFRDYDPAPRKNHLTGLDFDANVDLFQTAYALLFFTYTDLSLIHI